MKKAKIIVTLLSVLLLLIGVQGLWAAGTQETGAEKVYEIKIGHANIPADNSALHVTGMVFEELVEEYSGGRIQAEIYPSGQLGSDAEMADLVVSGAQEDLVTSLNLITQYAPRFRAFLLPYMFENNENFRKARTALWDEFNDYLIERANMRLITLWDSGYRHVMSTKPVYTLDDLKKLKQIRMPESLEGRTVLDVGAWDGFFSFEAERRGAARVLAVDSYCWGGEGPGTKDGFNLARRALGSRVEDREVEVLDLSPETAGGSARTGRERHSRSVDSRDARGPSRRPDAVHGGLSHGGAG